MTPTKSEPAGPKRKRRLCQYSIRTLLVVTLLASIPLPWFSVELRKVERRRLAYEQLTWDIYTCNLPSFPWYSSWLHKLLGDEESYDLSFLVLNNFASVSDSTLVAIANFENLKQLWLNGEISITDAGLKHLKGLKGLRDLSLADAPVTAGAVERLRRSLPDCDITWNPPTPNEQSPPSADQPGG